MQPIKPVIGELENSCVWNIFFTDYILNTYVTSVTKWKNIS